MNETEQAQLVELLQMLEPGHLPEPIFFEMCRLNTLVSVEVASIVDGRILLLHRNDKHFGDVEHIPGTMVRGNEIPEEALARLLDSEFANEGEGIEILDKIIYTERTPRGIIVHLLHITNAIEEPDHMYSMDDLPENTLNYHRQIIEERLCKY